MSEVQGDNKDIVVKKFFEHATGNDSAEKRNNSAEALQNIATARGVELGDLVKGLVRFRFKKKPV